MKPKEQYDKFVEHVKQSTKKFTLSRSSLKPLFEILDEQMKKNKIAALDEKQVAKALGTDKRLAKYQEAIETLLGVWGTAKDYVIPKKIVIPKDSTFSPIAEEEDDLSGPDESVDCMAWVKKVEKELSAFKDYMSADMFMNTKWDKSDPPKPDWKTGFAGCVNPKMREEFLKRYREFKKNAPSGSPMMPPQPGSEWKPTQYKLVFQEIDRNKAAICTQFALAAAHILTKGREGGPQVEIVAYDNHVYILVGRKGGAPKNKVPNDWQTQKNLVIVDGWAAAMGFDVIYQGLKGYPYTGMIDNLDHIAARFPLK